MQVTATGVYGEGSAADDREIEYDERFWSRCQ
jgi:hypothetical protein